MASLRIPEVLKGRSRVIWIALLLVTLTLVVKGIEFVAARYTQYNWEALKKEKVESLASSVGDAFSTYQENTYGEARRIASTADVKLAFATGAAQIQFFRALESAVGSSRRNVELYDTKGNLLAWAGSTAGLQHSRVDVQRETSFVSRGAVYSYLTIITPVIQNGATAGFVVMHRPFDVNYPFSNRFISTSTFTQTFPNRVDIPLTFDFSSQGRRERGDSLITVPLRGIRGNTIGVAYGEAPLLRSALDSIHETSAMLVVGFIGLLSLALLGAFVRMVGNVKGILLQAVGIVVGVWSVRYLWLFIGFPSTFLELSVFDPRYYASPFGFGIAKSIGELFLTSLAAIGSVGFIAVRVHLAVAKARGASPGGAKKVLGIGFSFLLVLSYFLMHRGLSAVFRSAVFDSTLRFNDPLVLFPGTEAGLMLVNLLLLVLAFVAAAVVAIDVVMYSLGSWTESRFVRSVMGLALFGAGAMLFGVISPNPLTGIVPRSVVLLLVFGTAVVWLGEVSGSESGPRRRWISPRALAITGVLSVAILMIQLDGQIHEGERRKTELLASEFNEPADFRFTHVTMRAVQEMKGSPVAEALERGEREDVESLAFGEWARSVLSKEGYNCSVSFFDSTGHLVSNFRIGVSGARPVWAKRLYVQSSGAVNLTVWEDEGSVEKTRLYVGSSEIDNGQGKTVGRVEVLIATKERGLFQAGAPPILQSQEREEAERYLRTLVVSEYTDGELVYTTGEEVPRLLSLPPSTETRLASEGSAWTVGSVNGIRFDTFYSIRGGNPKDVFVLSWKRPDWRLHLFDFVRYILFYLVLTSVGVALWLLVARARGRLPRWSFRNRLLSAFSVVSFGTLILIAYYSRVITVEQANQTISDRLTTETAALRNRLLDDLGAESVSDNAMLRSVDDDWCEARAIEAGTDFSIYDNTEVYASSKPELFQAQILEHRLSSGAFVHIVLQQENFYVESRMIGSYDYQVGYRPLFASPTRQTVLAVPLLYRQIEIAEDLARRNVLLFGVYAVIMLVALVVGTIFANRISAPLRQLIAATQRVAQGDLDYRISQQRLDEIGELQEAFNKMTTDLRNQRNALLKAERELAWKEMAKQVAHEIKNPLTPMKLSIQHLRQAFRDGREDVAEILDHVTRTVIDQIDALGRIASQFADFARMPERRAEDVDIHEVVQEAAKLFSELDQVQVKFDVAVQPLIVHADREELRRAFINIMRNAVQAMNEKGVLTVRALADAEFCTIVVIDSGPGIPREILPRLFQPNFSTKSEGMGLGLAIVKKTVDDLGGRIEITSDVGKGTTVVVSLPRRV